MLAQLSIFDATVVPFSRMLGNMSTWLDEAIEFATQRKFDPNLFFAYRLAPDQFSFGRQVQAACDTAKFCAAKLSGQTPPTHEDNETTLVQLQQRIVTCRDYLGTFQEGHFAEAGARKASHQWMGGKGLMGMPYVLQYAIPNFYFHATTAYAILRHAGVDVGKVDFLGELPLQ